MEVYPAADRLELKVDTSTGTPPASLPNVKQNLKCQISIEQYESMDAFVSNPTLRLTRDSFNKARLHF